MKMGDSSFKKKRETDDSQITSPYLNLNNLATACFIQSRWPVEVPSFERLLGIKYKPQLKWNLLKKLKTRVGSFYPSRKYLIPYHFYSLQESDPKTERFCYLYARVTHFSALLVLTIISVVLQRMISFSTSQLFLTDESSFHAYRYFREKRAPFYLYRENEGLRQNFTKFRLHQTN